MKLFAERSVSHLGKKLLTVKYNMHIPRCRKIGLVLAAKASHRVEWPALLAKTTAFMHVQLGPRATFAIALLRSSVIPLGALHTWKEPSIKTLSFSSRVPSRSL